jgi:hypothetical protein
VKHPVPATSTSIVRMAVSRWNPLQGAMIEQGPKAPLCRLSRALAAIRRLRDHADDLRALLRQGDPQDQRKIFIRTGSGRDLAT